jgi:NAD(P)-dependent dehydrogenase (short-subunit alcohol dehydrogenase family)/pimeloyl-ACP methyl ester carboxylesterase
MSHSTTVRTSDGLSLAVYVQDAERAEGTVVAVHGYPDDHTVWDGVVAELAGRYRVVTFDERGAGASDAPRGRAGYLLDRLAADLVCVIDAVGPDAPVHLLGHDWGSIQAWHALTSGRLAGRVASFTSISGPDLDHAGRWFRSRLRRPTPGNLRKVLRQAAASWYVGLFQLPVLPELGWRSGVFPRALRLIARGDAGARPGQTDDALRGIELYRANMGARLAAPRPGATTVPVQVLAPTRDPFVTPALQAAIEPWTTQAYVRRIPGGHWLPRARPEVVARCVTELAVHVDGGPAARELARARTPRRGRRHDGQLVLITGGGSGIGRASALAFADAGADVVVVDRDEASAKQTRAELERRGVRAGAYQVDVADAEQMTELAGRVLADHGVPDVLVNNAGIGMAGPFARTSLADWQRIVDVNLWGVIHGCRLFAEPMVARGEGGRIVNLASAAAYLPSRTLPAYCTTKAAVLMLSECLRGELAEHGIGVIAVCPGLVHTNITATARFVGVDEVEQRRRQRASFAAYGRRNFTPQRAAKQILRAVERNTALAPVTPEASAALVLSRLTPGLLRAAAKREVSL